MSQHIYIPPAANGFVCENEWREYLEKVNAGVVSPNDPVVPVAPAPVPSVPEVEAASAGEPMPGPDRWAMLHMRSYAGPVKTASWFYKDWLPLSGSGCCGGVLDELDASPVLFDSAESFFDSGVDFHNAINRKLEKIEVGRSLSRFVWRRAPVVRSSVSVPLVSSLAPGRLDHQLACVESWQAAGFYVHLMQTKEEIEQYRGLVSVDWIPVKTERPLIREMVRYGMVINSDCMMAGPVPSLLRRNEFFLRWNFKLGRPCREEEWGLDACLIDPDALPSDFPFMIGEPFWDYAVPAFLRAAGAEFFIRHDPWLCHLAHDLNWCQDDWHRGHNYVASRLEGDFSSASYRRSLDPGYVYDKALGMWISDYERSSQKVFRVG